MYTGTLLHKFIGAPLFKADQSNQGLNIALVWLVCYIQQYYGLIGLVNGGAPVTFDPFCALYLTCAASD